MASYGGPSPFDRGRIEGEGRELAFPATCGHGVGRDYQSVVANPDLSATGVLMPFTALRSETSVGIGDTGSMRDAVLFCARARMRILQVLPINESGGDNSPYLPISNFAITPLSIEMVPERVPGLRSEDLAAFIVPGVVPLLNGPTIQYDTVRLVKEQLLRAAFRRFSSEELHTDSEAATRFETFRAHYHQELETYSLYRHLVDRHFGNTNWTIWNESVRTYPNAKEWLALHPDKEEIQNERLYHTYVQWIAREQWMGLREFALQRGVELMGDIPFGVNRYSCDVWANPHLFDLEWSMGAPAESHYQGDPFVRRWGQNWGAPAYLWDRHREEGYAWWSRRVELTTEIFSSFRFDHALGAFRFYAFPWIGERNGEFAELSEEQAKERTGGRLPKFFPASDSDPDGPAINEAMGREFFTMLESAAKGAGIVAEDLGVAVPPYVRKVLDELDIPGYFLPMWEHAAPHELVPPTRAPKNAVITFGTHDHEPLVTQYKKLVASWLGPNGHEPWLELNGWMRWLGEQGEPATDFTDKLHANLLGTLLSTPSRLAILNLPDLLGSEERWNCPGMIGAGNWTTRLLKSLSEIGEDPVVASRLGYIAALNSEFGR